jgi:hypothetical protein
MDILVIAADGRKIALRLPRHTTLSSDQLRIILWRALTTAPPVDVMVE